MGYGSCENHTANVSMDACTNMPTNPLTAVGPRPTPGGGYIVITKALGALERTPLI